MHQFICDSIDVRQQPGRFFSLHKRGKLAKGNKKSNTVEGPAYFPVSLQVKES